MTREETKQVIQQLLEENADLGDWTNHKDECQKIADALDLAYRHIEAWEKVVEEINDSKFDGKTVRNYNEAISDCLKIINKHLSEVEE